MHLTALGEDDGVVDRDFEIVGIQFVSAFQQDVGTFIVPFQNGHQAHGPQNFGVVLFCLEPFLQRFQPAVQIGAVGSFH